MAREYIVPSRSGMNFMVPQHATITIIDVEGQQVVDFYAINNHDSHEIFSPGVTIDCNESLKIKINEYLYSNRYRPMFQLIEDTVQAHDLIHPCCRTEMYDFFYQNGAGHPNCYENITNHTKKLGGQALPEIHPLNIFMNTRIKEGGDIEVFAPQSQPNDYIVLQAMMDVQVFVAACSVTESLCNGGRCKPIKIVLDE